MKLHIKEIKLLKEIFENILYYTDCKEMYTVKLFCTALNHEYCVNRNIEECNMNC